jgi:hypothetical protein
MTDGVESSRQDQRPGRIANRYDVHELLGHGGMASVYRVTDIATGREAALKQLMLREPSDAQAEVAALFEREYHTLAQLCHPRVIEVYDYGVNGDLGPYYTMELLDGGDLRNRAPLPWQEACALLFDVCSSLALLHSRRLLHRDISPRNIRCTRDGQAKLFDFGAMTAMGRASGQIVGTPAFASPETVYRSELDGRADLFSLGATLYYALTGSNAYPARTFSEALVSWTVKPVAPSTHVPNIPAALDDLVMSLLSLEPALRPHTAFEVMQRLAAIAGFERNEPEGVSRAYLSTPVLVGREEVLARLSRGLTRALRGRGTGLIIRADPGLGRSRVLDACVLEAKTLGATVLRAAASSTQQGFSVAFELLQNLLESLPRERVQELLPELFTSAQQPVADRDERAALRARLYELAALRSDPEWLQGVICRVLLSVSKTHPVVVAVDDVHRIDEPSAAVLATLVDKAPRRSLLIALTADSYAAASTFARDVLARRCEAISLTPLSLQQTQAVFGSVFGDVPNLELLAHEIYQIARGNPRQSMDVAQHLVDRYTIEYSAGTWTLPSTLTAADLPSSAEDAIVARIQALAPLARFLGEAHALAFDEVLTRDDYHALRPELDARAIDAAISELSMQQALNNDGRWYSLANRVWTAAFKAGLSPEASQQRHCALVGVYRGRSKLALVFHLASAGLEVEALDMADALLKEYERHFDLRAMLDMNAASMGPTLAGGIDVALRLGRPPRQVAELRRWLLAISVAGDEGYYWHVAEVWLEQLKRDSGFTFWQEDLQRDNANERVARALQRTQERYLATPEPERVYRVDEAIRFLAQYVVISIAIGAKTSNSALIATLPELLEPFIGLSPMLEAIWQNAIASCEYHCTCHYERARLRWIDVLHKLDNITGAELEHVDVIRNAVACAVGFTEARLGLASAANWATQLDRDPLQKVSAMHLRRVVRLEQGDWVGADRLRRHAEVLALQARAPQMFSSIASELSVHTGARDLAGLKDTMARIEPLALAHPGWLACLLLAEARFQLIRGDFAAAESGFAQCIEMTALDANRRSSCLAVWIGAQAGRSEALLALERIPEARDCAASALATCHELEIDGPAQELARALALAEAKLADFSAASARIEALIQRQLALGVSGLKLGLSYEARAQIAIWAGDSVAFEQYSRLTAREYRYGAGCPLGARYERLLNEARRCGFVPAAELAASDALANQAATRTALHEVPTLVLLAMKDSQHTQERAAQALRLLCESRAAHGGHFYLAAPKGAAVLISSQASIPAPDSLLPRVQNFLVRESDRSETRTVVQTNTSLRDIANDDSVVQLDGARYELLLVACVKQGVGKVVGVIALVDSERKANNIVQDRLLSAIALQMLEVEQDQSLPNEPG